MSKDLIEMLGLREIDPLDQTVLNHDIAVAILINEAATKRETEKGNGTCRGCRKPISEKRLAAIPGALRCTPCQERWEKENLQ